MINYDAENYPATCIAISIELATVDYKNTMLLFVLKSVNSILNCIRCRLECYCGLR